MLTHTFRHIPGIGLKSEKRFWEAGLTSWEDFKEPGPIRLTPSKISIIKKHLQESQQHLNNNPLYFYDLLNVNQHWRLFPHFRHTTVFLDIETTGLSECQDQITTIATYDGSEIRYYINGENLESFIEDVDRYDVLVSYNGKTFDIPFLEHSFARKINKAHIDLRYVLRN
ncbi:MAG: ribonuclease H-like domain-containing protein, partial [Desulfobulbaceae bacterium]|nr:ribonuclease H-like domain-containing protein [Desulfobulbaceae bacterium]